MSKKSSLLLAFLTILCFQLQSQEVWSLQRCIEHAQKNSLDVLGSEVDIRVAEQAEKSSKMARLPNLNFSSTGRFNFGRSIDFTTNTFANIRSFNNSLSLDTDVPLYRGGAIHYGVKQSGYDLAASKASAQEIANNLALQVANAYLQVLFAEEQLLNAQKNRELTQEQLDQTDRLIKAGTLPFGDRLAIVAQLAQNEQLIIAQENNIEINYLTLKNLMQLEPDFNLRIEKPEMAIEKYEEATIAKLGEVYGLALQSQPQVRAGEMRLRSAEIGVDIAKSALKPNLTLFGGLSTNFSSLGEDLTAEPDLSDVTFALGNPQFVEIDGEAAQVAFLERMGSPVFPQASYGMQLSDNFGQGVGVSLNIPIFNRGQTNLNIERARLNVISSEIQNNQIRQQLKADIQNAIAQAKSAKRTLIASRKSVEANELAYDNAQKRFDLGAINSFELTTARNNLDRAKVDLIVAKYDYLFRLKIVDFYMGKQIELN
ncbi:MAG: TolC family protein [Bacteroidota bacterium]